MIFNYQIKKYHLDFFKFCSTLGYLVEKESIKIYKAHNQLFRI